MSGAGVAGGCPPESSVEPLRPGTRSTRLNATLPGDDETVLTSRDPRHGASITVADETISATHYRTDFGGITFGVEDSAVTPLIHASIGAAHPNPASMTDFLPVIDRFNTETRR